MRTLTFTEASLVEALGNVQCLHDMSVELIAECVFANAPAPSAEVEAVEVVGWRVFTGPSQKIFDFLSDAKASIAYWLSKFPGAHVADPEPVMLVAQHQRIVAAKDAEIARLKSEVKDLDEYGDREELKAQLVELRDSMRYRSSLVGRIEAERDELRAQLSAQQAAVQTAVDALLVKGLADALRHTLKELDGETPEDIDYGQLTAALQAYEQFRAEVIPAAPQQEPMAEVGSDGVFFLRKQANGEAWPGGNKLYAAAPQQGVVMPEKMAWCSDWEAGWNACRDEFARLNADRSAQTDYPECSGDESDCPENEGRGCCGKDRSAQGEKP